MGTGTVVVVVVVVSHSRPGRKFGSKLDAPEKCVVCRDKLKYLCMRPRNERVPLPKGEQPTRRYGICAETRGGLALAR